MVFLLYSRQTKRQHSFPTPTVKVKRKITLHANTPNYAGIVFSIHFHSTYKNCNCIAKHIKPYAIDSIICVYVFVFVYATVCSCCLHCIFEEKYEHIVTVVILRSIHLDFLIAIRTSELRRILNAFTQLIVLVCSSVVYSKLPLYCSVLSCVVLCYASVSHRFLFGTVNKKS